MFNALSKRIVTSVSFLIRNSLNLIVLISLLLSSCGPQVKIDSQGVTGLDTPTLQPTVVPDQEDDYVPPEYMHPEPVMGERPETDEQLSVADELDEDSYRESLGAVANTIAATPSPESPLKVEATPGPAQTRTQSYMQTLDAAEPTPPDADCSDGECVFWVRSSTDDAGPDQYCTYYTYTHEIYLGECTNGQGIISGFRFPQVNIPAGSVIHEAHIEFTVDGPYSDSLDVTFYGEDKGHASSFSSSNQPSSRVLTDASANWQIASTDPWVLGEIRNSPDLTDVVQEIIDRSDWNSGNALAIIVQNTGPAGGPNHARRVIGYDRPVWYPGVDHAARLVIRVGSLVSDGSVQNSCYGTMDECYQASAANANGSFGRPINTRTGGLFYQTQDMSVPTSGRPLVFNRTYSSLATDLYSSTLGYGWTHSLESSLIFPDDPGGEAGYVLFKLHTANQYQFIINANGTYRPAPGISGTLVHSSDVYTLTLPDQSVYTFDADGQLQTWADAEGHTWTYSYDVNDRLEQVSADGGTRYLSISYDTQGRIASVADHTTERSIAFAYDTNGDLVSMTDVMGEEWEYEYDAAHHLTRVLDPLGNTMERTEYDAQGRAVRQWDGLDNLIGELIYNADGTTTITDAFENIKTHTYNVSHTLSGETDPLGGTTNKTYDLNFRPRTITDVDGDATTLLWSTDGTNLKQVMDAEGGQTDITYDALHNPTSVIDPLDYLTTFEYDGTRLTKVTDALESETTYTYTPEGYLESVTDAEGNTTSYTYDSHGQRISMTDPLENQWTYSYDDLGRLVDTTDPFNRVTHNEYDAAGRLIRVTQNYDSNRPLKDENQWNIVTTYGYDARGRQTSITDALGRTTSYEYDAEGRLVKTIDPDENETINTYDEAGRLLSTADALNHTTTYTYDDAGRLISTTDALSHTTSTTYNLDGTVASTTDALNRTTSYTYDDLKRVLTVTQPGNGTIHITYDAAGNMTAVTDVLGKTTEYEYDALGRVIKTTDPLNGVTENFYDDAGQLIQTKDARGKATTYAYDEAGRQISVTDALGNVTSYEYDDMSRRTAVIDAAQNRTEYTYDRLDRVIAVRDPLGHFTYTEYDALGQVLSHTDANGNAVAFEYDNLGRLLSQTDALNGETSFTYDAVGNLLTMTDARGSITTTTYDELNRPVVVIDPLENSTTTTFDAAGQVIATTNALDEETVYGYNARGQQTSVTDPLDNVTQYTYDLAGRMTAIMDANDIVTAFEYDDLGRLTAVIENYRAGFQPTTEINVRTEYTYDANGNRLTIKDGNQHITIFTYDDLNRLISESDALQNTWSYQYDELGNRISMMDANGNTTVYSYDDANRLGGIDAAGTDADVSFSYDPGGRRTQMTDAIGITSWTYDELNRPVAIADPFDATVQYGYDAVGNRTSLTYPDERVINYVYDPANQLTEVLSDQISMAGYQYDNAGQLIQMTRENGVHTIYGYDHAGRLLSILHGAGTNTLSSYQYTYDEVGNRVQAVEEIGVPELLILEDGFERSDLSAWSGAETNDGDLSVTPEATIEGSYGMQAVINDASSLFVWDDLPEQEITYHVRFYFDLNQIEMGDTDTLNLFQALNGNVETAFQIHLRYSEGEGGYQIGVMAVDDDQNIVETEWLSVTGDLLHAVEVEWVTPSGPDAGDGHLSFWLDGRPDSLDILNLDTDSKTIDSVRLGILSPSSDGINGVVYFDDFVSNYSGYIGLDPDVQLPFADTFESGNLSAWSSAAIDGGDLSVSSLDLIEGEHELEAMINDTNELYVAEESLEQEHLYHARFYFDPNAVEIPEGESLDLLRGLGATGTAFSIRFSVINGDYALQAILVSDDGTERASEPILIVDDFYYIEMEWRAAGSDEYHDGHIVLSVNDSLGASVGDGDNDARLTDSVQLGVLAPSSASISGSVYFDDFISILRSQDIGQNPNVQLPDYLPITTDGFESGDFSGWSSAETDDGDLSVSSAAAIEGSYGLQAVINDQSDLYVTDMKPMEEDSYRARFYFDPNSVQIPEGGYFDLFRGTGNVGTSFLLRLGTVNNEYALKIILVHDDETVDESAWIPVGDRPHQVEVGWWAAWSYDTPDGRMFLWMDDQWKATLAEQDNDTKRITAVQWGVLSPSSTDITGTIYLDDFTSVRNGDYHIGLDPNVQLPPSWQISADGFESGDVSNWSSASADDGDLNVSSAAAIEGSYGLEALVDDDHELFVHDNLPLHESHYDARFYFDPNSVTIPEGEILSLLRAGDLAQGSILEVRLQNVEGEYQVQAVHYDDVQTLLETGWYALSDEAHFVEVEWWAASAPEEYDGYLSLYLDDGLMEELTGIDNDNLYVDYTELGILEPSSASITGTLYFDDFLSSREGHVGPSGSTQMMVSEVPAPAGKQDEPQPTLVFTATSTPTLIPTITATPGFVPTLAATAAPEKSSVPNRNIPEAEYLPQESAELLLAEPTSQTITYTYDPLYRLSAADYSTGGYYHYTYDAVGNRLTEQTHVQNSTYVYDDANRLASMNGVPYTWDNNGNLLNDGMNTYTYDSANRLKQLVQGANTYTYGYNGLGDRLSQNGVQYTVDLNTGLTQVLNDGTNTYLYGWERIAQVNDTTTEYFLGDALSSVRQLTNAQGNITLTQSYTPYGEVMASAGDSISPFAFSGEQLDPSGLIYLRARYYDALTGQFTTRDTYEGDINTPASLNRFNYAHSNPVMYTDPSGRCIFTGIDTIGCALAAAGIGFVSGAVVGGAFGAMTYSWALSGKCGCEMQEAAIAAGSRWAFAGSLALSGGLIGGVMGGIAALAPIGLIAVSGLGAIMSGVDIVRTVNIIRNETRGITGCTAMRLMMDVVGIALSGVGIAKGIQAWRASGSGLSWARPKSGPIVDDPDAPGDSPDGVYCSFSEDTEVTTSEGDTPISEIQIGDYVLAWNEETGEIDWYPVTAKMEHDDPVMVYLTLDGEEITTTPEHPFYTDEDGWVAAGELIAGMHVRKADDSFGEINATRIEESTQRMYNLTVDEAHTFFVGDGQWLVHNQCDIVSAARALAEDKAMSAKSLNSRPKVIAVLETSDGTMYPGRSGHHEQPSQALLNILNRHPFNFGCAEVSCLNQAIAANKSLQGAKITAIEIKGPLNNPTFAFKDPCPGGCSVLLSRLGITVVP